METSDLASACNTSQVIFYTMRLIVLNLIIHSNTFECSFIIQRKTELLDENDSHCNEIYSKSFRKDLGSVFHRSVQTYQKELSNIKHSATASSNTNKEV